MYKKTVITILILLAIAVGASAANYDQALINLWNRRPDLQKAFPGTPYDNKKLEAWAAKYGWQEAMELYNFYPQKQIVEKIIENKTGDRIKALENQINDLNKRIVDLDWKLTQEKARTSGKERAACISETGNQIRFKTAVTDIWAKNDGTSPTFCWDDWELVYFLTK